MPDHVFVHIDSHHVDISENAGCKAYYKALGLFRIRTSISIENQCSERGHWVNGPQSQSQGQVRTQSCCWLCIQPPTAHHWDPSITSFLSHRGINKPGRSHQPWRPLGDYVPVVYGQCTEMSSYSLFTLRKARSPLTLNRGRGFLRVSRLSAIDKQWGARVS